jgi:hypothetical protein
MGMFYAAVEGDPLDSGEGGCVLQGSPCIRIEGEDGRSRHMALLGHTAYCQACGSTGVIVAAPGSPMQNRMADFTSAGRRQALGGDLVMCKCARHPTIIPVHGRRWTVGPDAGIPVPAMAAAAAPPPGAQAAPAAAAAAAVAYDEHFILVDAETGQPVSGFAWGVQTSAGTCEGCTGADGRTETIHGQAPETITLAWILQTEIGIRP